MKFSKALEILMEMDAPVPGSPILRIGWPHLRILPLDSSSPESAPPEVMEKIHDILKMMCVDVEQVRFCIKHRLGERLTEDDRTLFIQARNLGKGAVAFAVIQLRQYLVSLDMHCEIEIVDPRITDPEFDSFIPANKEEMAVWRELSTPIFQVLKKYDVVEIGAHFTSSPRTVLIESPEVDEEKWESGGDLRKELEETCKPHGLVIRYNEMCPLSDDEEEDEMDFSSPPSGDYEVILPSTIRFVRANMPFEPIDWRPIDDARARGVDIQKELVEAMRRL